MSTPTHAVTHHNNIDTPTAGAPTVGKSYMQTYVVLAEFTRVTNEDGTPGRSVSKKVYPEAKAAKEIEEAQAKFTASRIDDDLIPEIVISQSVSFTEAKTVGELLELCTAPGKEDKAELVALAHFNRGAILAQQNEIRSLLMDEDFSPVEGTLALAYAIAQKSESRAKSPIDKAAAQLSKISGFEGISADQLQKLLTMFEAANKR